MNATVTFSAKEANQQIAKDKVERAMKLKLELDEAFKAKITTPDGVYSIYEKLNDYKHCSGEEYKITFEENTIV